MKNLNTIKGFNWAAAGNNKKGFGKVSICGESFWLKNCIRGEDGQWSGVVDNYLIFTEEHGLKYGDKVTFSI